MSFQAPIGTKEERATGTIWPGTWHDATGFLTKYEIGIHTGADLNLAGNADAHSAVYAIGDGTVTFAARYHNPNAWGNIVVINHGTMDGKPLFSRYGHVENIQVSAGQSVQMGDRIASVGDGFGLFTHHLHFDISNTTILATREGNWPAPSTNPDPNAVKLHYVDPKKWLQDHFRAGAQPPIDPRVTPDVVHPDNPPPVVVAGPAMDWFVIAIDGLFIRDQPSTSGSKFASVLFGARVPLEAGTVNQDTFTWGQISIGPNKGFWIAKGKADQSEIFMSTNPPTG